MVSAGVANGLVKELTAVTGSRGPARSHLLVLALILMIPSPQRSTPVTAEALKDSD